MAVSSAVRDYRRVKSIFAKQTQIISTYSTVIEQLRKSPFIEPQQLADMVTIYGKMLGNSADTISDLSNIVSPATLQMTDAERMKIIDQLDVKITDQLSLLNYYTQRNLMVMRTAQQTNQDLKTLQGFMAK